MNNTPLTAPEMLVSSVGMLLFSLAVLVVAVMWLLLPVLMHGLLKRILAELRRIREVLEANSRK